MKKIFILFLCLLIFSNSYSQQFALFEINLPETNTGLIIPVSVSLENISSESPIILEEIKNGKKTAVPFQITGRTLHWIMNAANSESKHVYELSSGQFLGTDTVKAVDNNSSLTISYKNKNYLQYYYKTVYPPEGIDTAYKKSGFIHPLWTPHGQVLTRIQPPDHYHHYGIWNPWTHVLFEGDTVDFWNIGDRKGTVRFVKMESVTEGAVFSEFKALQEHVVFKNDGSEKTALNEIFTVRVYPGKNPDYYITDIESELSCAGENPVLLLEYRYGGLGWRATEKWDRYNSEVITSEGKSRKDADGSLARWCIVQGEIDNDYAGVVLMSHPENYNHPEPLRIWPEDQYGRGDMFVNFSPTKNKDWLLKPGKKYLLKYRFVVFNGKFDKEKADAAWNIFAEPVEVHLSRQ